MNPTSVDVMEPNGIPPQKVLVPIDIGNFPLEVFPVVNGLALRPGMTIILLYVVNLNIVAPETRVYDELASEARWHLGRLAGQYLNPIASALIRIRTGKPAEEILAEAKEQNADLILLPANGPSFWTRLRSLWKTAPVPMVAPVVEKVMREAGCGVFITLGKTRFDCEKAWGRPARPGETEAAASEPKAKASWAPAAQQSHARA